MSRKKTVALKPALGWGQSDRLAQFTATDLGRHLGVSRQRASALLNAGRIEGAAKLQDGRWQAWLPIAIAPGARGPLGARVGPLKAVDRPTGRVRVVVGAIVLPFRGRS